MKPQHLDGCNKALATACKSFIGVDGCHLKNKYGGIQLAVFHRDLNDQYLLLTFAMVEDKNNDS